MQYCFLQHWTLLLSPVPSTTGCCFCFGSIPSFFLELFLHRSPVVYWAPTNLGSSSFSVLSFCLFILFMGFSRQGYWSGLPFPSPVDHILSDLSTMTRLSRMAPQRGRLRQRTSAAVRSYPTSEVRGGGWEELSHMRGQWWWPGGATPCLMSGDAAGRSYLMSKVRSSGCTLLEQPWRHTPRPR